jgi:hypothetical protein|tara:strand:- start:285 stop:506 length:222 start_codon:yes stop_codon:yes gene_type:complete
MDNSTTEEIFWEEEVPKIIEMTQGNIINDFRELVSENIQIPKNMELFEDLFMDNKEFIIDQICESIKIECTDP